MGIPAAIVVMISIGITLRQARASSEPVPKRFSGSSVVLAMPSLLGSPKLPSRVRVAIIRDEAAASFYTPAATLDTIVRAWRDALVAAGADARIVSSSAIGSARDARVLVIPSSPCLTVATREAIDLAGARGQGLILTGAAGLYDAGCRRLGYGLVVAVTGASRVEPLESRPMAYVTIPYGGPFSADIPPGSRLDLSPAVSGVAAARSRRRLYRLYPQPEGRRRTTADRWRACPLVVSRGAGCVLGIRAHECGSRPWSRAVLTLLVRNSVAWTGKIALSSVEPWPNDHRAAATLTQDVEDQFTNARYAADSLDAAGIPGTFFLVSDLARRNTRVTRRLFKTGEVGSHTDNHRLLGGTSHERQYARLDVTQRDLTEIVGEKIRA